MASSCALNNSIGDLNGRIVAALTCPVCLDLCKNPKILPQCGHSLCATCLESIYKKFETAAFRSLVTFPCPECRAECSVPVGELDKLKINYPVLRVTEILLESDGAVLDTQPGETCPHADFLTKSKLSTCSHCDEKFCKPCLFNHMELTKLEINFISNDFHDRFDGAKSVLGEKADKIRRRIDENVRKVQEEIATSGDALIEAFRHAILENCHRLSEKAEQLGEDLYDRLASEIEIGGTSDQQEEIDRRLKKINKKSVLFSCAEDFVRLHQLVSEQDKKISTLERIDESEVSRSILNFNSDSSLIGTVSDLLTKGYDVTMETKEVGSGKLVETPRAYQELHLAAKSGDLAKLMAIFSRNDPASHQIMIDHHDKTDNERTVLHQASYSGSFDVAKYLTTELGTNLSACDGDKELATHLATRSGRTEIVKLLLNSNNKIVNEKGWRGESVLFIASGLGNLELVRFLVDELNVDFEQTADNADTWSPLMKAASTGHLEIVKFLFEHGGNLLAKYNLDGKIALHLAASHGHLEIVKFLLEKNPEMVDFPRSRDLKTPLGLAVSYGQLETVDFLAGLGKANLEQVIDKQGNTPLLLAAEKGCLPIVTCLIDHGADYLVKGNQRETILHRVAKKGFTELARFLLVRFPNLLEMKDDWNKSPLNYAVFADHLEIVKCLVEDYRADVNTAPLLDVVQKTGRLPMVRCLVENGANLEAVNSDARNLLRYALWSKDGDLIAYLADLKPELINAPDKKGETPFQAAKRYRLPNEILELLMKKNTALANR